MQPTRRLWSVAALAGASVALAVIFSDPLILGVPLGVGVWVIAEQFGFTHAIARVTASDTSAVTQSLAQDSRLVDESTTLSIAIADDLVRTDLDPKLTIELSSALLTEASTTYALSEVDESISIQVRAPVSGAFNISQPTLRVTSPNGLFRESVRVGNGLSLTVEPRVPRDIHVGTGGQRVGIIRGSHIADIGTQGFGLRTLREYVPGDPMSRIDWKATARLGDPHVWEFDTKTSRRTHLFVDQRPTMFAGEPGRTKLDYAREIGLWLVGYSADADDPIGVSVVDETRVSGANSPPEPTGHYRSVRRRLLDLSGEDAVPGESREDARSAERRSSRGAREAHRIAVGLGSDSPYTETLTPYFEHIESYLDGVSGRPLFEAVQARLNAASTQEWLVIVSDDTHRDELLATARAAADRHARVSLFLLPSALFDEGSAAARGTYAEFESFRQQLSAIEGVTAFEAGPDERLTSLFATAPNEGVRQ